MVTLDERQVKKNQRDSASSFKKLRAKRIWLMRLVIVSLLLTLTACGFFSGLQGDGPPRSDRGARSSSAPYGDRVSRDGAPNKVLAKCQIENAIPKVEAKSRQGNPKTYRVHGKTYKVYESAAGYRERGNASWYGTAFHGNLTSNGERYNMYSMSAAHKHLPLPSYVEVRNLDNGRKVIVRVNDRGPFVQGRIIDLSYAAATKLDILKRGTARVEIEVINPRTFDSTKFAKENGCGNAVVQEEREVYPSTGSHTTQVAAEQRLGSSANTQSIQTGSQGAIDSKVAGASPTNSSNSQSGSLINKPIGKIYLQIAAYSQPQVAEKQRIALANELKASGYIYPLGLYEYLPDDSVTAWYRMRLGPLESMEQARKLADSPIFTRFGKVFPVSDSTLDF